MSTLARPLLAILLCVTVSGPVLSDDVAPKVPPVASDVSRQGGTLSDKLNATNGVIRPEGGVDPQMAKPTPPVGTMPVIPPAGSPGAAPGVQPK